MKHAVLASVVLTLFLTGCNGGGSGSGGCQVSISEFALPSFGRPVWIVAGPDGNLWFSEENGNNIGRITPAGVITEFAVPTSASSLKGLRQDLTVICGSRSTQATILGELPQPG